MKRDSVDVALAEELASHGLRATRQRVALLRLLRAKEGHHTAAELHRELGRMLRDVSRKTVYEILGSFVQIGLASCVSDSSEPSSQYEARDRRRTIMPAVACAAACSTFPPRPTDRSVDAPGSPRASSSRQIAVTLRGVCLRCREER